MVNSERFYVHVQPICLHQNLRFMDGNLWLLCLFSFINSFTSILAVESSSKLCFNEKECTNISKQRSSEMKYSYKPLKKWDCDV